MTGPVRSNSEVRVGWAADAAAAWGVAFAALSAYWGLGGELGVDQLGVAIREQVVAEDRGLLVLTGPRSG